MPLVRSVLFMEAVVSGCHGLTTKKIPSRGRSAAFVGNLAINSRQISSASHISVGRNHIDNGKTFVGHENTRLFSSSNDGSSQQQQATMKNIGWEEMQQLVEDYESSGRDGSGLVVIDVREPHEVAFTGKVSPNTHTLPLGVVAQYNVFAMDDDDFEEVTGFKKPSMDETIIFSCAAGIRSVHACNFASQAGYSQLVNYMGGANEWFSR
eukprot:CAMPEP_0113459350 /NCGR_PEP_ID=MMETSP0014_2-20120614/10404_1 /TAXON_ID=2857 /ORGANISM="Nitzschia sp." /LENGTH=208 /DNA_ID=CAMNT_0000350925 /DNA_START=76 /DNA_END=702 /DNA_ORIENTATION=+ /assembly_acc=CAM_ASM_000159